MALVRVCPEMIPGKPAAIAAPAAPVAVLRNSRRSEFVDSFFIAPPLDPRVIGNGLDLADPEKLAMHVGGRRSDSVPLIQVGPVQLQHLHLNPTRKRTARIRPRPAPKEHARVSAGLRVHPLDVQDKV